MLKGKTPFKRGLNVCVYILMLLLLIYLFFGS